MIETQIDDAMIPFAKPKFHLGQRVVTKQSTGYVVGMQRGKYLWSYLVAEGDPPNEDGDEDWHQEHTLSVG